MVWSVEKMKVWLKNFFLYLGFIILMVCVMTNKNYMHIDEVSTYLLSNHHYVDTISMEPEEGIKYLPSSEAWLQYITVNDSYRFDFHSVMDNQSADVHPPFYYLMIHAICSLFPNKFSIWYAEIINIIFACLTLVVIRKLFFEIVKDKLLVDVGTVFFVVSTGVLSATTFLRMYIVAMFFVTLITYMFVYSKENICTWKFYYLLFGITLFGALTHYYFVVYLFFLCVVEGIVKLITKKWKELGLLFITMCSAASTAIGIFPSMITHMFGGYRGEESISNLKSFSIQEYGKRLKAFGIFMNQYILGGIGTYILIVLCIFLLIKIVWNKYIKSLVTEEKSSEKDIQKWLLMIIPCSCYYLLVSKMAVYISERYIQPIYGIIVVMALCSLYKICEKLCNKALVSPVMKGKFICSLLFRQKQTYVLHLR